MKHNRALRFGTQSCKSKTVLGGLHKVTSMTSKRHSRFCVMRFVYLLFLFCCPSRQIEHFLMWYPKIALNRWMTAVTRTQRKHRRTRGCFSHVERVVCPQVSYLTWGVLQERVMTRSYGATDTEGSGERFKDSQFLVFMNRILALTVAGLCCVVFKQPRHAAPMYKYSFASLSNILSSWCQYEALKYISFPTQVHLSDFITWPAHISHQTIELI